MNIIAVQSTVGILLINVVWNIKFHNSKSKK